jgi:hypothetical protein
VCLCEPLAEKDEVLQGAGLFEYFVFNRSQLSPDDISGDALESADDLARRAPAFGAVDEELVKAGKAQHPIDASCDSHHSAAPRKQGLDGLTLMALLGLSV